MRKAFDLFAGRVNKALAHPLAFLLALALILTWAGAGPFFAYSDQWSLFINTSTTIITFLMAFVILAAQSRDNAAIHVKLDELLRSSNARDELIALERRTTEEIEREAERIRLRGTP